MSIETLKFEGRSFRNFQITKDFLETNNLFPLKHINIGEIELIKDFNKAQNLDIKSKQKR